jgi:ABC-type glycerol-3-phosphate transport system permease component
MALDGLKRMARGTVERLRHARGLSAEAVSEEAFRRATDPGRRLRRRVGGGMVRVAKHLAIWIVLAFAFLPLYLMVIVSVKSNTQFYDAPATITPPYHWENWRQAWDLVTPTVANSLFIATTSTALTLLFALGAAYFFARLKMPMSGLLWNAILVLMMMPAVANLVPLFRLLKDMDLLNTISALIIVGASAGQVFAIFVLRSFVADIPQDLFEAAEIDGASHFQQIWVIVLPLSAPIVGTIGVMQFIASWNDFVLPLIIIRDHARLPVMVQLLRMAGEYIKFWGPLMAGYTIASIPIIILFIFSMKLFIRGLTEGAIKG